MKRYHSLVRFPKEEAVTMLNNCSHMLIGEKIDGQNVSFKWDLETDKMHVFSRNVEIKDENHPYYKWVFENIEKEELIKGVIYYGEWGTRHRRIYPPEKFDKQFFLFDLYIEALDVYVNPYASLETLNLVAVTDKMNLAHIYYDGVPIKDIERIKKFYEKSGFDGKPAEGVVVKDYNYRDRFGNCVMVKIINPEFEESKSVKKSSNRELSENDKLVLQWVTSHITEGRVQKTLLKLQDEKVLPESICIQDMGTLMKNVPKTVIEDAIKEELDELETTLSEKDVIKSINKIGQRLVGQLLRKVINDIEQKVQL